MKKIIALILAAIMAFSLCACGTQHIKYNDGGSFEFTAEGQTITGNLEGYSVHQSGDMTYVVIDINTNN